MYLAPGRILGEQIPAITDECGCRLLARSDTRGSLVPSGTAARSSVAARARLGRVVAAAAVVGRSADGCLSAAGALRRSAAAQARCHQAGGRQTGRAPAQDRAAAAMPRAELSGRESLGGDRVGRHVGEMQKQPPGRRPAASAAVSPTTPTGSITAVLPRRPRRAGRAGPLPPAGGCRPACTGTRPAPGRPRWLFHLRRPRVR